MTDLAIVKAEVCQLPQRLRVGGALSKTGCSLCLQPLLSVW